MIHRVKFIPSTCLLMFSIDAVVILVFLLVVRLDVIF